MLLSITYICAQAPSNDNCTGAIQLNVDAAYIPGNVAGATAGPVVPCNTDLGAPGGTANDDVWYKFTATKPYLVIAAQGSSQFNAVIQVFSGTCENLAIMDCANEGKMGRVEKLPLNHYVPGQTYYFRVFDEGAGKPVTTDFQIRVYTPVAPSNDECANAKPVEVRDHCQSSTENQEGATGSPQPGNCANGAAKNDDIWYSFIPKTKRVTILAHASHNYRAVLEVFDNCGGKAIGCTTSTKHNQAVKLSFTNLNPGQKYYFRVYNYYTPLSKSQTFELCVYDTPLPANDECAGATNINSGDTLRGDVSGSTASAGYAPPCAGTSDDDLWYKFNAVSTKETIELFGSPFFDGIMQVFDACNGKLIACVNDVTRGKKETLVLTGLTPGKDYFVRVFSIEDIIPVTSDFRISRTSGPKPLVNDECTGAIMINPGDSLVGSLTGSSPSLGYTAPCSGTPDDDVWYKFTAISSKETFDLLSSSHFDGVIQAFDACKGKVLNCVNKGDQSKNESMVLTGLKSGQTYYIRIFSAGNTPVGNGNFELVRTAIPPPSNDECANSIAIPIVSKLTQKISGKIDGATQSNEPCNDSKEANDVWYKFTAMGKHNTIRINTTDSINPVFSVFGGCAETSSSCIDSSGKGETEVLDSVFINNQTYYLRVYDGNGSNQNGTFTITVEGEQSVTSVINSQDDNFRAYPIPVNDVLSINFKDSQSRNLVLSDMQGNIMLTDDGILKESYNLSGFSPGVYILKITAEDKVYAIKIIKK